MDDSGREPKSYKLTPVSRAVLTACGASVGATAAPAALAQSDMAIEEVVVTARKRTENLQDVPISILAFDSLAIQKKGIKSLEDYARQIPSLTYSSWMPGNAIVVFRGVTVTADAFSGNSSAAIFFNDMPITSQGLNPEVATLDLERMEAVSGPQPTTYGSSAQSGVLKFVTAKPNLSSFGGFVEASGSYLPEGEPGYEMQAAVNIPIVENEFALRLAVSQSAVGGYVDNIAGSTLDTHNWQPAWDSAPADFAYPGGSLAASGIAHITKTNNAVVEDDIGDIDTQVMRVTAAWQPNDDWLVTGMINVQNTTADGIASWHPEFGDLNQIRFKNESKTDDWYVTTLVVEGDLGFADFTSATGFMDREIVYDLDNSTYLHQFQGVGGVYYNMFDIAYFPMGYYYAYAFTVGYPAYNGTITGWEFNGLNSAGYATYLITELTDNTSRMWNKTEMDRVSQEFRLSSKDEDQRYQWMLGGFYEKVESSYVFRSFADGFGDSLAGKIIGENTGLRIRDPGVTWFGTGDTKDTEWSVFGEFGFDFTDHLNLTVGARYFEAETDGANQTLNGDGALTQNCLEDQSGVCITSPDNITEDNRVGTSPAQSSADSSDTLPLARLTYSINDDVMIYGTYSEGFRIGGTNILRAVSTASPRYDADRVINNEIGFKSTLWDGRFVLNIAAYQMTWEDIQLVAADPTISFGWGQVTVNAGEAEIEGAEVNFALAATDRLRFDGAFSYTSSEVTEGASIGDNVVVEDGEELPLSPDTKFSLGAEYSFPLGDSDAYVRLDYSYVGEQTNATQGSTLLTSSSLLRGTITELPSYDTANLIMGLNKDTWSLRFAVDNITDERAITYIPTRWTDGRLYSIRPREYTLTFRMDF